MRVIGNAIYLPQRARKRALRAVVLVIAGVALIVTVFVRAAVGDTSFLGGIPAFVGVGALLVGWMQAVASGKDRSNAETEGPVVAQLRARLSDEYLYIRRAIIPGQGLETDGLLLGPHGVLVVGIASLQGSVAVRGDDWYILEDSGEYQLRNSPTWELTRRVRALQRIITQEALGKVPVQGAVVLLGADLQQADRPGAAVVPLNRIGSYVDYLRPKDGEAAESIRPRVEELADLLIAAKQRLHASGRAETLQLETR